MIAIISNKKLQFTDRTPEDTHVLQTVEIETSKDNRKGFLVHVKDQKFDWVEVGEGDDAIQIIKPTGTIKEKTLFKTDIEINQVFAFIGKDIEASKPFYEQWLDLWRSGVLLEMQQKTLYNSQAQDWEILDPNTSINPYV